MRNKIILVIFATLSLFAVSCNTSQKEKIKEIKETVDSIKNGTKPDTNKTVSIDPSYKSATIFGGCGFPKAFMSWIVTGNYETALTFTDPGSIQQHGRKQILDFYQSLKINYKNLKMTSAKSHGDTTVVICTANEMATSRIKKFVVVVTNDTCKLLLPEDFNNFLK